MSSDPRKPEDAPPNPVSDQDLDTFLRGEDAVSRAYTGTQSAQVPAELDTAVLDFARRSAQSNRRQSRLRRWQRPLALAAVLTLSVSVLLQLWKEPQVRDPMSAQEQAAQSADNTPAPAEAMSAAESEAARIAKNETAREATTAMSDRDKAAPEIPIAARKQQASAEKPRLPQPKPPVAAEIAIASPTPAPALPPPSPPSIASESPSPTMSAPVTAFATAPSAEPQAESRLDSKSEPRAIFKSAPPAQSSAAPAMGAAAAADFAKQETAAATQRKAQKPEAAARVGSDQAAFVASHERARAGAAALYSESKKRQENAQTWQAPRFDGLQLGTATRAEVRARYGEPRSQDLSSPEDRNPDRRELLYDFYDRLPGQSGVFEFYYERLSLKLLSVRRVLQPAIKTGALIAELGWTEPPLVSDSLHPPCDTAIAATARGAVEGPLYWRYPARGAYWFLSSADSVEQLIYEAECDLPPSSP